MDKHQCTKRPPHRHLGEPPPPPWSRPPAGPSPEARHRQCTEAPQTGQHPDRGPKRTPKGHQDPTQRSGTGNAPRPHEPGNTQTGAPSEQTPEQSSRVTRPAGMGKSWNPKSSPTDNRQPTGDAKRRGNRHRKNDRNQMTPWRRHPTPKGKPHTHRRQGRLTRGSTRADTAWTQPGA